MHVWLIRSHCPPLLAHSSCSGVKFCAAKIDHVISASAHRLYQLNIRELGPNPRQPLVPQLMQPVEDVATTAVHHAARYHDWYLLRRRHREAERGGLLPRQPPSTPPAYQKPKMEAPELDAHDHLFGPHINHRDEWNRRIKLDAAVCPGKDPLDTLCKCPDLVFATRIHIKDGATLACHLYCGCCDLPIEQIQPLRARPLAGPGEEA